MCQPESHKTITHCKCSPTTKPSQPPSPTIHTPFFPSPPKPHSALIETKSIADISLPMILTGLLLYSRSMVSMLFLGRLGGLALAGGSLAVGFSNITGYSVLSGLSMGMEPICGQAFGARKHSLLGLALQKTVLLLLLSSIPIAVLWLYMQDILLCFGQDPDIASAAHSYVLFALPDLLIQSFLHPIRIYLRTQSITLPLTYAAAAAFCLHIPINYFLVFVLQLGIRGVALGAVWTNLNLVMLLVSYIYLSGVYEKTWEGLSMECLRGWRTLLDLAIPSCVSVCLEWWWYEIMILLCGLLANPRATVASMGILIQTTALMYIFPSSLSFAVSTRVGNELGANQPDRARVAAKTGLCCGFLLGLTALGFAFSVRNAWALMFTDDGDIVRLTSMVLPIIGLCELGNCPQTTGCGVLRGSARPKVGANVNLGSFYGVGMPVALCLGFYLGMDFKGLWFGMLAAQASCVAMMLVVLGRTDWELEARRAQQLTGVVADIDDNKKINVVVVVDEVNNVEEEEKSCLICIKIDQL
ncbi:MATE efflux family protein 9 [Acorus calamus]|uniref:Protein DETOXIFICATION n=1 Tax=Acorus calamus TaxID=4465 RepID=A0AAV9DTB1_ACOCL|nr:MATE efflux family protein 9 [Acorus calamus]